jgi:outer membrane receptor protein involved in Fe transport
MHHFELGYKGYFLDRIRVTTALYTNYEHNTIAAVTIVDGSPAVRQYQNIDEVLYYGVEFGTEMFLNDYFTVGGSFGVNRYNLLHSEGNSKYLQYIPMFTSNGYLGISPLAGKNTGVFENIRIMPRFEYVSAVPSGNSATSTLIDGRVLFHASINTEIAKHYSLSFAVNNIADELYYTTSGYPGAGRSFNISLGASF